VVILAGSGRLGDMCGRYVNAAATGDLVDEFDVEETVGEDLPPSFNIAPTDPVRVVVERPPHGDEHGGRQLRTVRWGLVPSWSKDAKGGARMINARIETVTGKPAFKKAAAARRCLVPALGYYEWQKNEGGKVPFFLHDPDGELLSFAGLYELWRDPAKADDDPARWLWTCTIITQQADDLLGQIHDRNPVVVPAGLRSAWLDCSSGDAGVAERLLQEIPPAHLEPYVVSAAVGNVRNNGPELIAPADDGAAPLETPEPEQLSLLD
jgi:putative SOS response-associated peptidase YedK